MSTRDPHAKQFAELDAKKRYAESMNQALANKAAEERLRRAGMNIAPRHSIDDATPGEWDRAARKPALERQEGGDHYKNLKVQPIEYVMANQMDYCEANVVKYITRHHAKGGADDIRKVIHYCELLLELKYGETP